MTNRPDTRSEGIDDLERQRSLITAYCRRRGSEDPEGLAAETIGLAWKRRDELKLHRCTPWLIATARNLLMEEYRARRRSRPVEPNLLSAMDPRQEPAFEIDSLDPHIDRALNSLSPEDREAVLLVAWDDLTPAQAAKSMGIRPSTFRVRLHRARSRMREALSNPTSIQTGMTKLPAEESQ